jgi:cell growth-regulating nucleolar protein
MFKGKKEKVNPQDAWNECIERAVSNVSDAPITVQQYIVKLGTQSNVPRNANKFKNFLRNSFRIHNETLINIIWSFLEKFSTKQSIDSGVDLIASKLDVPKRHEICDAASLEVTEGSKRKGSNDVEDEQDESSELKRKRHKKDKKKKDKKKNDKKKEKKEKKHEVIETDYVA